MDSYVICHLNRKFIIKRPEDLAPDAKRYVIATKPLSDQYAGLYVDTPMSRFVVPLVFQDRDVALSVYRNIMLANPTSFWPHPTPGYMGLFRLTMEQAKLGPNICEVT